MSNWEINRELKEIEKEKEIFSNELSKQRNYISNMLLNEMGEDINNVLNGKVKVKLSWKEKMGYKIKNFFNKLFEVI